MELFGRVTILSVHVCISGGQNRFLSGFCESFSQSARIKKRFQPRAISAETSCHMECRYVFSKKASRMHHYMPLECTIASFNRAPLEPIRRTVFSELPFNGFLISIFQSFTERCIQETLNEYCRNLGLLDDQTVPFEHSSQESIIIIYQNRLARTFAIY